MLYFDNASTTYVYDEVIDAVTDILKNHWGNPMNMYQFGLEANAKVEEARGIIANAIGADPDEIIFTSCSSESNALAINQREKCLCSPYEHHDIKENRKTTIVDEEYIFKMKRIVNENEWDLPYKDYLYAHMLVNNETGEIFDVKPFIEAAHELEMLVLIDATQALGNIPLNVHELDADFVSFSFHKVHAPKGIGALYVRKELKENMIPLIYGSQEYDIRGGTSNVPYIVGAGIAVKRAVAEIADKDAHCLKLRNRILEMLNDSDVDYRVNEGIHRINSILNLAFKGVTGDSMILMLDNKGISVSTGSACNTGDLKPSEVLTEMKVPEDYIEGAIRISMSLKNSLEDAEKLANEIINCYYSLT